MPIFVNNYKVMIRNHSSAPLSKTIKAQLRTVMEQARFWLFQDRKRVVIGSLCLMIRKFVV